MGVVLSKLLILESLLWALSMELASCHPSGAYNFEVARRF